MEQVPDADLSALVHILRRLAACEDPVLAAFRNAPMDDEETTEEDIAAWEEANRAIAEGRVFSDEEARRRLGL